MKVLKRSQVTEVVTKRQVSHTIEFNGEKYTRNETINIHVPYMNCDEPIIRNKKVTWNVYIGERTVRYLSAKDIKSLGLETLFYEIDISSLNGNSY